MRKGGKKGAELTLTQTMARLLEKELVPDLKERARMPGVGAALRQRWEREKTARRTGDAFEVWVEHVAEQVGAAWILSVAFIRTMEDRGLLERRRLAGPEAYQSEHNFFQLFPALGPRDYLFTVCRELSRLPGAEDLLGPKHNPAWRFGPSNAAAQKLLDAWRSGDEARTPLWTFEGTDTRFLGDLYQDLSADARDRFALLQTPDFVERFILKLTLDPAIEEFGLGDVRVIDPTCGSGHFLLGAFDRLFDLRLGRDPGLDRRAQALAALGQVHGVDLNPYAVAIARFRLTLAFLEKAGIGKIKDAPRLPLNLAVADSLLIAARGSNVHLASAAESKAGWGYDLFDFEDAEEAERILGAGYHAVVGNPPYITCKDSALREVYRSLYPRSAAGKFALAAPFTERFFQLGVEGGFVGLINANSFMKREFGKKLIEDVLPTLDITHVIDTSVAHIPGHEGSPTLILSGRNRPPVADSLKAVLGKKRGLDTPEDPENGTVWQSITRHVDDSSFEDEFITVSSVDRSRFAKHPWSLAGGGASGLRERLESGAARVLGDLADSIGITAFTLEDDAFAAPREALTRAGVEPVNVRTLVEGEWVRDWGIAEGNAVVFPYDAEFRPRLDRGTGGFKKLWPYRTNLSNNILFGGRTKVESGLAWFEFGRLTSEKLKTPLSITFAFVATHNHFALSRGGNVFKQSAPVIKLPSGNETEYLSLLAYLNSSSACFWMKQVMFQKNALLKVGEVRDRPERQHYEFAATPMAKLPVPDLTDPRLPAFAAKLDSLARERAAMEPAKVIAEAAGESPDGLVAALSRAEASHDRILRRMVVVQEEIDWVVYSLLGLCPSELSSTGVEDLDLSAASPDERPFVAGEQSWSGLSPPLRSLWAARSAFLHSDGSCLQLETANYKRPWFGTQGVFHRDAWTYSEMRESALREALLHEIEELLHSRGHALSLRQIARVVGDTPRMAVLAKHLVSEGDDPVALIGALVREESIPFASALQFTDRGLERRRLWEQTWDLQRREDAGETLARPIPVPPKYDQKDYRETFFWRLRGKLDVPKERFISYPGAEQDDDKTPLIGWAGWTHLHRAQALAAVYQERKDEAWTRERLTPLLAGLLELIPWLKQWHNEPDPSFGNQRLGDYFAQYVESEARENGLSLDDLRAWRPTPTRRGGRGRVRRAEEASDA